MTDVNGEQTLVEVVTDEETDLKTPKWFDATYLRLRQTMLVNLLQPVVAILEAEDIPYWITGGTLLGAIRHCGFVPHDDDIDLECYEADFGRIRELFKAHPGITVERTKPYKNGMPMGGIFTIPYPSDLPGRVACGIDIFLRKPELVIDLVNEFPSREEVFPLQKFEFHGIKVNGPNLPGPYLSRCYGPNWSTTVCVWNHLFNIYFAKAFDPDRVSLTLEDYNARIKALGYQPPTVTPLG